MIEKYLKLGWKLIPLNGKIPVNKAWPEAMTIGEHYNFISLHKGNIGIQTGKVSGIVVLDVDRPDAVLELPEALPVTPFVKTGKGLHYYFKYQEGIKNSVGKIAKGVDVRSDNGYVVAPPSIHPNTGKPYEWIVPPWECELAEFPNKEFHLLKENIKTNEHGDFLIVEGGRNNYLTSLAGTMRRRGFSFNAIFTAIYSENMEKCNPPLPESEVRTIAESVSRYKPEEPMTENGSVKGVDTGSNNHERLEGVNPNPIIFNKTEVHRYTDLKNREFEPVQLIKTGIKTLDEYFCGGLGLKEISLFIAKQETGKTTLGCFVGANAIKQGYNVLHVFYEDELKAVKERYDGHLKGDTFDVDLFLYDATYYPAKVPDIEKQVKEFDPGIVIIDYFARVPSIRGLNETRFEIRDTLMRFSNLARQYNCHIMIFDHVPIIFENRDVPVPSCYWTNDTDLSEAKMYKLMISNLMVGMKRDRESFNTLWFTGMKVKRQASKRRLFTIGVDWETGVFNG